MAYLFYLEPLRIFKRQATIKETKAASYTIKHFPIQELRITVDPHFLSTQNLVINGFSVMKCPVR